jgi:hypothetical protein
MPATRVYIVKAKTDPSAKPRLVRAAHPANALRHVADGAYSVEVAGQDDLITLLTQGAKVEDIKAEQHELPA